MPSSFPQKAARALRLVQRGTLAFAHRITGRTGPIVFRSVTSAEQYEAYLDRQSEKTKDRAPRLLGEMWQEKYDGFRDLFQKYDRSLLGPRALCVGARTGQEVVVLKDMGVDAVGVDLVAFPPHVIEGDMHNLPFSAAEFDFVFSNCFDHSPMPEKMVSEMERVCRGHVALWLIHGVTKDYYAENLITETDSVIAMFKSSEVVWAKVDSTIFDELDFSILMRKR